jgi:hypothetical protein
MKLTDLNPRWVGHGGEGYVITATGESVARTEGVGLICDCPCGSCGTELFVPFENPIGPGPLADQWGWKRTGETFETLTLTPSVHRQDLGGCGWHGFITAGDVRTA